MPDCDRGALLVLGADVPRLRPGEGAVDRNGADWLPEHDSHGQLAFTVTEYWRLTGDRALAAELWPAVWIPGCFLLQHTPSTFGEAILARPVP